MGCLPAFCNRTSFRIPAQSAVEMLSAGSQLAAHSAAFHSATAWGILLLVALGYGRPGRRIPERVLTPTRRRAWRGNSLPKVPTPTGDAMQVTVATAKTTVKDEHGRKVEGVVLTCSRCGKTVEVFGTSDASVKRGFVKLRETCKEKNFYVEEELQRVSD
jgi:hypothetical protein